MTCRQAFTQPAFKIVHDFFDSEGCKYRTFAEASTALQHMEQEVLRQHPGRNMGGFKGLYCLYLAYRFQRIRHFFLSPGVMPFALSCVKQISRDYFRDLPLALLATDNEKDKQSDRLTDACGTVTLALHFPVRERAHSIVACLVNKSADAPESGTVGFLAWDGEEAFPYNISEGDPYGPLDELDDECHGLRETVRAIYAFSLYIDAFPETVVEAGVGEIANWNHYRSSVERHRVERSAVLDEEARNSVSPHWRNGFMRVLRSERFTHKRWQSVWTHGHMVKGAAYEVLDDAPALPVAAKVP